MICGCTKSRPTQQYRCNACHEREQATDYMWEDRMEEVTIFKDNNFLDNEIKVKADRHSSWVKNIVKGDTV